MEQARIKIAVSNIIAEIDRRCFDITHPVNDDMSVVKKKVMAMRDILDQALKEIEQSDITGEARHLENVVSYIKQIRIQEYGEQNKEADR